MSSQGFVDPIQIHRELRLQFVVVELELASTFSDIALATTMDDRFRRNAELAHQSHNTAMHFLTGCILTSQMKQTISDLLHEIRPKLKELDRFLVGQGRD